nr:hypothetical protein BaRGS_021598 [Batillaria attramentaria]
MHSLSMEDAGDEQVRVGKLDVANVSKAIHRYGTIPKGIFDGKLLSAGDPGDPGPVTMETILDASEKLRSCIDRLAVAGNKTSTNFMLLSEEVQAFHSMCCRFIDALPPHAKFHARELLSRLLTHSQSLKTFTSTSPNAGGSLLNDIQTTNRDIMSVIQR